MELNPGDGTGIVDEVRDWCDADSSAYSDAKIIRRVNQALETVEAWIRNADGTWQFDDENYATVPEGTSDLVEGQSDYSFANTFLDVEWVKVKNAGGYWQLIPAIDQSQLDRPLEDWLIAKGFPSMYDKIGDTLRFYPAPTSSVVTLTGGLKVGFSRGASQFATSDTTKTPGFALPYHIILAYMAARPYCMTYKQERVPQLNALIGDLSLNASGMKKDIISFYTNREKDSPKKMTMRTINSK